MHSGIKLIGGGGGEEVEMQCNDRVVQGIVGNGEGSATALSTHYRDF